jgi:CRISPR/Cas system-associated exonuclease Cas4 (RecB family)
VDKIPEPDRPLKPGQTEHPNDRGTRVHEAAERYIRGGVELIPELIKFKDEFENLREQYSAGRASLEGEWGVTAEWTPTGWMGADVWLRIKLDALVHMNDEVAVVIDYKTGKKTGNEIKHAEQGQLYAVGAKNRYPKLERVIVEFWYTDQDEMTSHTYDARQIERFRLKFHLRGIAMTTEEVFAPKPNAFNCKWCPYNPAASDHCAVGIPNPSTPYAVRIPISMA